MNCSHPLAHAHSRRIPRLATGILLLVLFQAGSVMSGLSGKDIVKSRCTSCHALPEPAFLSGEEWVHTLEIMAENAGLDRNEKAAVLDYMTAHEREAVVIASMQSEKRLFEQKCSVCHTTARVLMMQLAPESSRHIVMRMQERAPDLISDSEVQEIVEYLSQGAPASSKPERKPVSEGPAAVFRERCTACHTAERVYLALREGKRKGIAVTWAHIVNRMREKAPQWISEDESQQIMQYLESLRAVSAE